MTSWCGGRRCRPSWPPPRGCRSGGSTHRLPAAGLDSPCDSVDRTARLVGLRDGSWVGVVYVLVGPDASEQRRGQALDILNSFVVVGPAVTVDVPEGWEVAGQLTTQEPDETDLQVAVAGTFALRPDDEDIDCDHWPVPRLEHDGPRRRGRLGSSSPRTRSSNPGSPALRALRRDRRRRLGPSRDLSRRRRSGPVHLRSRWAAGPMWSTCSWATRSAARLAARPSTPSTRSPSPDATAA